MSVLRLAWLNLARHRASTFLAVIALGLTVACAGLLLRTARLAEARFTTLAHAGDALVAAKGGATDALLGALNAEGPYPRFIPLRLYATLINEAWYASGNRSYATSVVPVVYSGKLGSRHGTDAYRVAGTIEAFFSMPAPSPTLVFARGGWTEPGASVVIGAAVARRERIDIGDTVAVAHWTTDDMPSPAQTGLEPRRFVVSGVLAPTGTAWDRLVFTNLVQAQSMMEEALPKAGQKTVWGSLVLHYLIVHTVQTVPGGADSLEALIDQQTVTQIVPVSSTLESLRRLTDAGRRAATMMIILSAVLALVTLSALMLGRFEGMARQMALLAATGWRKGELRRLLFWEGLILGGGAVAFGGALDALAFPLVRSVLGTALPDPALVSSPFWTSAPVWVVTVAVTVCASLASSWLVFRGRAQERLRALG